MDVAGSVHDSKFFANNRVNKKLQNNKPPVFQFWPQGVKRFQITSMAWLIIYDKIQRLTFICSALDVYLVYKIIFVNQHFFYIQQSSLRWKYQIYIKRFIVMISGWNLHWKTVSFNKI